MKKTLRMDATVLTEVYDLKELMRIYLEEGNE